MKKLKAILALVLVACLFVTLFAACANTEEKPNTDAGKDNTNPNTNTNTGANTGSDDKEPTDDNKTDEPVEPQEIIDLVFWIPDINNAGGVDHKDRLEKLVNTITEPEGIHVNMTFLASAEYRQNATLDIAAGEQIDLMCYWGRVNVINLYNNKMTTPLDDLLAEYAPSTMELMGDFLPATTLNGEIHSVPVLRNYVTNGYICFNQDELDKWGLTEQAKAIESWTDFEAVLGAIHENVVGTGTYPFVPWGGTTITYNDRVIRGDSFADIEVVDTLGDGTGTLYINKDGKISLWQADPAYAASCAKAKEWFDKGWCWPDSMFDANVQATEIISQRAGIAEYTVSEEGVDVQKNGTYDATCLAVKICNGNIKTSTMTGWGMGIPISAQEPEAAMRLLEMIYTNETLMKALVNGEEGVDYELVDGQAKPLGKYNMGNYILGNNLLTYPQLGTGADFYDRVKASNDNAERSAYMGFVLVTDELQDYIANISAVTDQYRCAMQSGSYSESYLAEYLNKLESAGVNDYLAAVQEQLDAWIASK